MLLVKLHQEFSRGHSKFGIIFITVTFQEKDYYHVVSVGQLSFAYRSYGGRSCRMQGNGWRFIVLAHNYGFREVKWKYSIDSKQLAFASFISCTLYRWESPYLVHVVHFTWRWRQRTVFQCEDL